MTRYSTHYRRPNLPRSHSLSSPAAVPQKVKACLRQMQQQWRELVGVMQAAVAETAGELRRQHDLLARLAAAESPRQTQQDRQDQQAEQGQHEGAAQQPAPPPKREGEGAASPAPQPGGPGAVLVQQMLAMQAADVERSKRFAELAQVGCCWGLSRDRHHKKSRKRPSRLAAPPPYPTHPPYHTHTHPLPPTCTQA
jgi:type IV secretory pathway VirB10-like protein